MKIVSVGDYPGDKYPPAGGGHPADKYPPGPHHHPLAAAIERDSVSDTYVR